MAGALTKLMIKFVKYSLYKFEKAHSALAWLNYYSRFIFPELPSSILELSILFSNLYRRTVNMPAYVIYYVADNYISQRL